MFHSFQTNPEGLSIENHTNFLVSAVRAHSLGCYWLVTLGG